jgi:hypothetical protein
VTAGTRDLAGAARQVADDAPAGSTRRKAYGCAAIALESARTVAGARKILAAECPDVIRADALDALDQLTAPVPGRRP